MFRIASSATLSVAGRATSRQGSSALIFLPFATERFEAGAPVDFFFTRTAAIACTHRSKATDEMTSRLLPLKCSACGERALRSPLFSLSPSPTHVWLQLIVQCNKQTKRSQRETLKTWTCFTRELNKSSCFNKWNCYKTHKRTLFETHHNGAK